MLEKILSLSWEDFAQALEKGFRNEGYAVQRVDCAADFELEKAGRMTLVCARRWKAAHTGIEPLKELATAGERRCASECRYAVADELTERARAYAMQKGATLVERVELAKKVRV